MGIPHVSRSDNPKFPLMNAAPSISNGLEFRRTLRGFEPTDVDELVSELRDQRQQAEDDRAESDRRMRKRRAELTEARGCAAHVKADFTERGTAFEETFRLQADAIRPAERIERAAEEILYEAREEMLWTEAQAKDLLDEADAHVSRSAVRMAEIAVEAQGMPDKARRQRRTSQRQRACRLVQLVSMGMEQVSSVRSETEELINSMAADAEPELGRQESTINQFVLGVKLSGAVPDTFEAWPYRSRVMRQASTPASDRVRVSA